METTALHFYFYSIVLSFLNKQPFSKYGPNINVEWGNSFYWSSSFSESYILQIKGNVSSKKNKTWDDVKRKTKASGRYLLKKPSLILFQEDIKYSQS